MPKLWSQTIATHRRDVHDAVLAAAAALVAEHGLRGVTMSRIAVEAGISRATLYNYFPGVEDILLAWHEKQVGSHLEQLEQIAEHGGAAGDRLEGVLRAYARNTHQRPHSDLAATLHQGEHMVHAHSQLHALVEGLLRDAAVAGDVRNDVASGELAAYCLAAVDGAARVPSKAAVERLVDVTLDGLRPLG